MNFDGSIIKKKAKENGYSVTALAEKLHIARQAVNTWMDGRVPRGKHLVDLCALLGLRPADFFKAETKAPVTAPLHRAMKKKTLTPEMTEASLATANEYLNIFRQAPASAMVQVVRVQERSVVAAKQTALRLRKISGIRDDKPMSYEGAFKLLDALNVFVVLRPFPKEITRDSYAFYSRIADQRVVFVNIDINVLDLIFQLLHETVHAVRDESPEDIKTEAEESFCDKVAMFTQFPDFYVKTIATAISGCKPAQAVNLLKKFSGDNGHSLYGLYYRLREEGLFPETLSIGGAAANLNKEFPSLRDILYREPDPYRFVKVLFELSPHFMKLVKANIPGVSVRKVGEWLGLDSTLDIKTVIDEINRRDDPA
ncbi:MAG: XRE family transcriptional regulator [Desulfobacteraceae bacterium]|nr:MAG: XRE family transcriptional regulator [Desulfobacteraceae bacterium]